MIKDWSKFNESNSTDSFKSEVNKIRQYFLEYEDEDMVSYEMYVCGFSRVKERDMLWSVNPNNGNFKLIADSKISFIKVFNVNGSLIKEFKNVFSTELDFSLSLDAGIYLIKIAMFNGVTSDKRLIIE